MATGHGQRHGPLPDQRRPDPGGWAAGVPDGVGAVPDRPASGGAVPDRAAPRPSDRDRHRVSRQATRPPGGAAGPQTVAPEYLAELPDDPRTRGDVTPRDAAGVPAAAPDLLGGPGSTGQPRDRARAGPLTGPAPDPLTGPAPDPLTGPAPDPLTGPAPDPLTGPAGYQAAAGPADRVPGGPAGYRSDGRGWLRQRVQHGRPSRTPAIQPAGASGPYPRSTGREALAERSLPRRHGPGGLSRRAPRITRAELLRPDTAMFAAKLTPITRPITAVPLPMTSCPGQPRNRSPTSAPRQRWAAEPARRTGVPFG